MPIVCPMLFIFSAWTFSMSYLYCLCFELCSFPANVEVRAAWVRAVRRVDPETKKEWIPSKYSVLCSSHFQPEDFRKDRGVTLLQPSAVPSIFNMPQLIVSCKLAIALSIEIKKMKLQKSVEYR